MSAECDELSILIACKSVEPEYAPEGVDFVANQPAQAMAERCTAGGVQQEVNAEVGVVEQHEELLQ